MNHQIKDDGTETERPGKRRRGGAMEAARWFCFLPLAGLIAHSLIVGPHERLRPCLLGPLYDIISPALFAYVFIIYAALIAPRYRRAAAAVAFVVAMVVPLLPSLSAQVLNTTGIYTGNPFRVGATFLLCSWASFGTLREVWKVAPNYEPDYKPAAEREPDALDAE